MYALAIVPRFLRDPMAFLESIQRGEKVKAKAFALALSSLLFLAIYGFMTGLSHGWLQALSSAVKMPLLFIATVAFCLPALHFFSLALLGTQLTIGQVATVVLTGIGVTSFLLLGLSPVTFFFVITSENYPFSQLLAVIFVAISGCIGLHFLWKGMASVEMVGKATMGTFGRVLLGAWIILYAFVASQMTWRLSPLVGDPTQPFVLLQPSRDNFYVDALRAFLQVVGLNARRGSVEAIASAGGCCLSICFLFVLLVGFYVSSRRSRAKSAPLASSNIPGAPEKG